MFSAKSVEREQLLRDKVSVCLVLRVWGGGRGNSYLRVCACAL